MLPVASLVGESSSSLKTRRICRFVTPWLAACRIAPEIVWGEFLDAGFSRILPDNVPDDFLAQPASPHRVRSRPAPEDSPIRYPGRVQPIFNEILHVSGKCYSITDH